WILAFFIQKALLNLTVDFRSRRFAFRVEELRKSPTAGFFKIKFFLAVGEPPRRFKRLRGLPMTCSSRRSLRAFHYNQQEL
ncbi:hypothetical protein, partial [Bacillus sp. ISL-39]|uniref:hypothetical protein n=1 Tax=Bacillus sp. ISL-39 TaxID=2819124 RepID=UPI001BE5090A